VSTTVSISGSGQVDVTVFGQGTVFAGNGNDNINVTGPGQIVVGSGNDTLTLGQGGTITEHGAGGHDTINIGPTGTYTISEQGQATVTGAFGTATVSGGVLTITEGPGGTTTSTGSTGSPGTIQHALFSHVAHLHGDMHGQSSQLGATHTSAITSGHMTGGMGHDSMTGSASHNLFQSHGTTPGLVKNFVAGHDHVYLPGHSLVFSAPVHAISSQGEKTTIGLDHGKTTIELHGVHIGDKH
jgi:hypothetical protein